LKIQEILIKGYSVLKSEGIDTYIIDCQLILAKVLEVDRLFISTNKDLEVNEINANSFMELIEKRKHKMPVKYITQNCEFMGIDFYIKEGVLIPRPETETLVLKVIEEIKKNNFKTICDVCCGSGIIGISLAEFNKDTQVSCYDISDTAVNVTKVNINRLLLEKRVEVKKSDLLQAAINEGKKFDVLVSNPPYIRAEIIPQLMEDVKNFEPYEALYGGEDGLDFYRSIIVKGTEVLIKRGLIAFEIGEDQKTDVESILLSNGFDEIEVTLDLSGKNRVICAKLI
jgi:release factor glutamine methyltransferase